MDLIDQLLQQATDRATALRRLPESTYRLQFHGGFTFRDATAAVPYLHDLGVTHCYASPYLAARPGSTHGYDVIDHCRLNPEVGTEAEYDAWVAALRDRGMGHILDTVPNHVGVATNDNDWWNDVLAHGPASKYAHYFDIAWRGSPRPELHDKVLLPVLGGTYAEVLEKGELRVEGYDLNGFSITYYDRRFPISPETYELVLNPRPRPAPKGTPAREYLQKVVAQWNGTPGNPRSFDRLDELLDRQSYRLAYWRVASDEINYRRFFDINDLAALNQQHLDVFEATHVLILRLLADGKVGGLRIDHPDGLYDPAEYFLRLQRHYLLACAKVAFDAGPEYRGQNWDDLRPRLLERLSAAVPDELTTDGRRDWSLYVSVEKILAVNEPLPQAWAVHGTSGYDFLNMANGLFVDPAAEEPLTRLYIDWTGDATPFEELVYEKKRLILDTGLSSELQMLAHRLDRLAQTDRRSRDFTHNGLRRALREVIACFPVYRAYVDDDGVHPADRRYTEAAVDEAIRRNPKIDPSVFHFIRDTLLLAYPYDAAPDPQAEQQYRAAQREFSGKFQQVTAPTTAKGIEDTTFYIYNRLISLNEVGGDPAHFGVPPPELHRYFQDRQRHWPYALSALSTHDTKRSEDVRARINVLSEIPDDWRRCVERWGRLNERHKQAVGGQPAPDRNEEYLLYQTLVGTWPLDEGNADDRATFVGRIQAYMEKALKEAKVHTTWTDPDPAYDAAVKQFVASILDESSAGEFLADVRPFQRRISHFGLLNSLSQTLLKLTAPGVPDTYQGTDLWDFSLVDPDNRRPVDYDRRRRVLADLQAATEAAGEDRSAWVRELLGAKDDGRIKLYLTWQALTARREHPGLFSDGEYQPVKVVGPAADHVFAFTRRQGDRHALVAVPRLIGRLVGGDDQSPLGRETWRDTRLVLSDATMEWRDRLTGRRLQAASAGSRSEVLVDEVFAALPFALLISIDC